MNQSQLEDIYYKLFDEETVKIKFSSHGKFASFRTRLYAFKAIKDDERDILSSDGYESPMINIVLHNLPGTMEVIAVMKFKEKTVTPMEFVEFDEVTQTWIEAPQHE